MPLLRRLAYITSPLALSLTLSLAAGTLGACTPREAPPAPPPSSPVAPPPGRAAPPPAAEASEAPPLGQLPGHARPLHYKLTLQIVPAQDRFSGTAEILVDLPAPRSILWMHARDLAAKSASARPEGGQPVAGKLEQVDPTGVAKLTLDRPVGPGRVTLHVDYDAPLPETSFGLYKVRRGRRAYAFTQFEATSARLAFPGFDEPAYKTPFDVTLLVPRGEVAISSGREVERASATGDLDRVTFATTPPLPTYLLAFAVGPLDVVDAPAVPPTPARKTPLPLRGVATKGRGAELAYALRHTGSLVKALEDYTALPYPFDKLDMIAVPDKRGAMENAGAVTFSEFLLLIEEPHSSTRQRHAFFSVGAHELAHMWFGDLVTMPWWNDLWLKEASANWLAAHAVRAVRPDIDLDTHMLDNVHGAMGTDGLVSARKIRQEIRDHHDITNAFDGITYDKGYGVITMFERWLGPEAYQRGIRAFLGAHRYGNATDDDYLAEISRATGRDVATPMRTFLDQPGIPLIEASLTCEGKPRLHLKQSRYLPLGSAGDRTARWQVPVCARYPRDAGGKALETSCVLLTEREGDLPLVGDTCPAWIAPNADGSGYYRWSLPAPQLDKLARLGLPHLSVREKLSLGTSVKASFRQGATSGADALATLAPLASDPRHEVAVEPIALLRNALDWLHGDPAQGAVEAYAQRLYTPVFLKHRWRPRSGAGGKPGSPGETEGDSILRVDVLHFLALSAMDPAVRKEAAALGRAYIAGGALQTDIVLPELAATVVAVALQEGDAALFAQALAVLTATEDESDRSNLLFGMASARAPALAARARELTLDPRLQSREVRHILGTQLQDPVLREAAWQWLEQNLDAVIQRLGPQRSGWLPGLASSFCDSAHAERTSTLFSPRIAKLDGGPRSLATTLESIHLCTARRRAQLDGLRAFFETPARRAQTPTKAPGLPAKP
ncbi:M1 family metallopeptidase [Chondromyces apiculatus]|uniref:Aminopeptidase n=1 Tax=Chondromyces apiculatus DSM 436 TaxID=1192034 RepID=A0A017TGY7_9BACT|nr:M1 family metallopeptidase [Chondromyces apiculatus]EYF08192.1 Aminopeptidase N [Chondromyces apiculatus DSM 436]